MQPHETQRDSLRQEGGQDSTFLHALAELGPTGTFLGLFLSPSLLQLLAPILLLAYDTLFFHPQQNNSHQGNWWWGIWEKQELLHWDDGPPHGRYECSERCSTLSSTLTVTVFSPSFLPLSNPLPSLPLASYLSVSFLSCSFLFSSLCPNPANLSHGIHRGVFKNQWQFFWGGKMNMDEVNQRERERDNPHSKNMVNEGLCDVVWGKERRLGLQVVCIMRNRYLAQISMAKLFSRLSLCPGRLRTNIFGPYFVPLPHRTLRAIFICHVSAIKVYFSPWPWLSLKCRSPSKTFLLFATLPIKGSEMWRQGE